LEQLGFKEFVKTKMCTVDQFMTKSNVGKYCNNPILVKGSCGNPSFFSSLYFENTSNQQIIRLFELIEEKNPTEKNIRIILGARSGKEKEELNDKYIDLYFNNQSEEIPYENINIILSNIEMEEVLIGPYYIKVFFPLNIEHSNKYVLDKILQMTNKLSL
jgi:hypothetical protein